MKNRYLALLLSFAGCASTPFNPKLPVESKGNFFTKTYSQDGKTIDVNQIFSQLKNNEATRSSAAAGQAWFYGAMISGGVGGYFIGYNLARESDSRQSGLLTGVAFIGASIASAYFADKYLSQAVEVHNQQFPSRKNASSIKVLPYLSLAQSHEDQLSPTMNLLMRF